MLFYRASNGPRELSIPLLRVLTATSLVTYPAGALLLATGPDTLANSIAGFGLVSAGLVSCMPVFSSSIQRIVGEEVKALDEFELRLRGRAMGLAYAIFTGLALVSVLYSAIAADKGFWFPSTYDEFNGVFWGVFLYAAVLPAAILSWLVDQSFNQE